MIARYSAHLDRSIARMSAAVAAGYCGEESVQAFMKRVGKEYPQPRINDGRRKLRLRDDLDRAILPPELTARRGSVTVTLPLPRYIIAKQLASGKVAIFHRSHEVSDTRMSDCHEPLGADPE
jgi:hypothetical protein